MSVRGRPAAIRRAVALAIALSFVAIGAASVAGGARDGPQANDQIPAAAALPTPPGLTERVSIGSDGRQGDTGSGGGSGLIEAMNGDQAMSSDARWVAFASTVTNLIPGQPHPAGGIFLRDRQSGVTVAIPWIDGGAFPSGVVGAEPAISADGGVVAFTAIVTTAAASRVVAFPAMSPFVLAWDRGTNLTELVSMDSNAGPTPGYQPTVSADGRYVAYTRWSVDRTPPVPTDLRTDGFRSGGGFFVFGPSAPCQPHSATITVTVTDPDDAVTTVTLSFQPNGSGVVTQPMATVGGNVWRATIDVLDAWPTGPITYWVQARDSNGNVSQPVYPAPGFGLSKGECIT